MSTKRIIITKSTMLDGKRVEADPKKVITASAKDARLLISLRKAKDAPTKGKATKSDAAE